MPPAPTPLQVPHCTPADPTPHYTHTLPHTRTPPTTHTHTHAHRNCLAHYIVYMPSPSPPGGGGWSGESGVIEHWMGGLPVGGARWLLDCIKAACGSHLLAPLPPACYGKPGMPCHLPAWVPLPAATPAESLLLLRRARRTATCPALAPTSLTRWRRRAASATTSCAARAPSAQNACKQHVNAPTTTTTYLISSTLGATWAYHLPSRSSAIQTTEETLVVDWSGRTHGAGVY